MPAAKHIKHTPSNNNNNNNNNNNIVVVVIIIIIIIVVVVAVVVVIIIIIIISRAPFSCETCSVALNKYKYKDIKHMHKRHPKQHVSSKTVLNHPTKQ